MSNIENENEDTDETVLDAVQNMAAEQQEDQQEEDEGQDDDSNQSAEEVDSKKKWVEFSPEQQEKFNDLYKQVKMSDARNQMKDQMLEKAMAKIEELEKRFSQTDQAEAEKILKTRLQEARDEGDMDKEFKILDEIMDFRRSQKEQPKTKEQPKVEIPDDPETRYVVGLAQETDERGQPLRPWLVETHPRYKTMLTQATIIANEMELEGKEFSLPQLMKTLDERMNKKPNTRSPDPMGANLTSNKNANNIKPKLSNAEKAIAAKLGMSEADYLDGKLTYGVKR